MSDRMQAPELRSPLHGFGLAATERAIDGLAGVWANEVLSQGFISLRGNAADPTFADATAKALGVSLPTSPCTIASAGGIRVLWLSPDEWLIIAARGRHATILAELTAALKGTRSQVVDNSGGFTEVVLLGRDAEAVLTHCTVFDLHALTAGRVAGSTFGKLSTYLIRDGDGFRLIFRRSFADYIWRFLVRAALPYGFAVAKLPPERGAGS